jgi:hypothetical protein
LVLRQVKVSSRFLASVEQNSQPCGWQGFRLHSQTSASPTESVGGCGDNERLHI